MKMTLYNNAGHLKHPLNAMNNVGTQNGKVHIVNVYKIGGVGGFLYLYRENANRQ